MCVCAHLICLCMRDAWAGIVSIPGTFSIFSLKSYIPAFWFFIGNMLLENFKNLLSIIETSKSN